MVQPITVFIVYLTTLLLIVSSQPITPVPLNVNDLLDWDLQCQPPLLTRTSNEFLLASCFTSNVRDSTELLLCRTIQICLNPLLIKLQTTSNTTSSPSALSRYYTETTIDTFGINDFFLTQYLLQFLVKGVALSSSVGNGGLSFSPPFGVGTQIPWESTQTEVSESGACLQLQLPPSSTLHVSPLSSADRCLDSLRPGCSFVELDFSSGAVFSKGLTDVRRVGDGQGGDNDNVNCSLYQGAVKPVPVKASSLVIRVPVLFGNAPDSLSALGPLSVVNVALGALTVFAAAPPTALEGQMLILLADNWCNPQEVQEVMTESMWGINPLFAIAAQLKEGTAVAVEVLVGAPLLFLAIVWSVHLVVFIIVFVMTSVASSSPSSDLDEGTADSASVRLWRKIVHSANRVSFPSRSWALSQLVFAALVSGSLQQILGSANPSVFAIVSLPHTNADTGSRGVLGIVGLSVVGALVAYPIAIAKQATYYNAYEDRLTHPATMVFPPTLANFMPGSMIGPPALASSIRSPLLYSSKKRRGWCTFQPLILIVITVIMTPPSPTTTGCIVQTLLAALTFFAYAVLLIVIKPYRVAMQNYLCALQSLLGMTLSLLLMARATNVLADIAPPDQAIATMYVVVHALGLVRGILSMLTLSLEWWLVEPIVWGKLVSQALTSHAEDDEDDNSRSLSGYEPDTASLKALNLEQRRISPTNEALSNHSLLSGDTYAAVFNNESNLFGSFVIVGEAPSDRHFLRRAMASDTGPSPLDEDELSWLQHRRPSAVRVEEGSGEEKDQGQGEKKTLHMDEALQAKLRDVMEEADAGLRAQALGRLVRDQEHMPGFYDTL